MAMKKLKTQLASHEVFGQLRFIKTDDDEIYFVGKDVAEILGYKDTDQAIRDHVDEEDKKTYPVKMTGQVRNVVIINESGLYSLILSSKLPKAKEFKRWVTSEVLPSIRKTGSYSVAPKKKSIAEILLEDYKNNNTEFGELLLPDGTSALMPIRQLENLKNLAKQDPNFKLQFIKIVE